MTGFEATNSIQPQRNPKYYKLKKKMTKGYEWAVAGMFVMVVMLCINHYNLLHSYEQLKTQLTEAYVIINEEKTVQQKIAAQDTALKDEFRQLTDEFIKLKENYSKTSRGTNDLAQQIESLKKQNNDLVKQMKDLANDNIALQNSLKMAASIGVKPQSYNMFEELEPRNLINRGKYVGQFLGTAYTPSKEECGNDKGITKSGEPIMPGVSIAVDNHYWPFGTVFYIKGLGYTVAMDTGSAIKGKYRFDFSVLDREFAMTLGSRKWDVYLVKMGKGTIRDIKL